MTSTRLSRSLQRNRVPGRLGGVVGRMGFSPPQAVQALLEAGEEPYYQALLEAGGDLDKAVTLFTEEGAHEYIPKRPTDA